MNTPIFQQRFVYFPLYWRGNFLCGSSGSCLLPPCSIRGEGERELEGCSNTSGQNKSFLQRHHVIHLPVNDTSSSYSSLNDLVCVALLVVRETAGGSLEMSLVIVWRCRQAQRDRDKDRKRSWEKVHWSHLRPAALIREALWHLASNYPDTH